MTPPAPVTRPCPQCGAPVAWTPDAVFRPFCSQRCRVIDLAAWAEGRYRIPSVEPADEDDESPPATARDA